MQADSPFQSPEAGVHLSRQAFEQFSGLEIYAWRLVQLWDLFVLGLQIDSTTGPLYPSSRKERGLGKVISVVTASSIWCGC